MYDIVQDLINEGALVLFHHYKLRCALDQSGNNNHGVPTDVDWTGRGAAFLGWTSKITVPDSPELRLVQGSIIILADNYIQDGVGVYVTKRDGGGVNYQYQRTASQLQFYNGTYVRNIAEDMAGKRYSAINFNDSEVPVGYADLNTPVNYSGVAAVSTDDAPLEIGNYSGGNQFRGVMQAVLVVNRKLTATEHSQLYGQLSAMTAPTKIVGHTDTPLTKSDWGANESDSAVTSGFIENTPFEVLTGSFKVVTDTLDGEVIKSFECISTGTIQFPSWGDGSDSDWTGYEDTGTGYTSGTLSLSSLVYSMTTDDKLAISDRAGNLSVRKE